MKDLIIGTAGHIDHGKTTLLKALTGIDADRLKEEQQRGITIDIGFAHLELGEYRLGFIDVPGHEKFVKNMLAGIGGIHLVMLVVSADESVMPQTVEHFQICRLLNIPRGIIVLTKRDLVEEELLELVREEVAELVEGSFLEGAPVVAVDSVSGRGMEELRETLLREVEKIDVRLLENPARERVFRLPVDRVFTIRGFGTVITGTPQAGSVRREETVAIHPGSLTAKVRGVEIFNRKVEEARAGQRTALNLAGVDKHQLERGMVLTSPDTFQATQMFDVLLQLIPESKPLKNRDPIRFHCGSGEWVGRLYLLEGQQVPAGGTALAQLRLDSPCLACALDHFVLRRYSPLSTIGGGIILDNAPPKHRRRDLPALLPLLREVREKWAQGGPGLEEALLEYFVRSRGVRGLSLKELVARTGRREESLRELLARRPHLILVPQEPPLLVHQQELEKLKEAMAAFVSRYQQKKELGPGVPREELKNRFLAQASDRYFQFVLDQLVQEKRLAISNSHVNPFGSKVELNETQRQIRTQILELLRRSRYQPPTLGEIQSRLPFPGQEVQNVYFFMLQQGELVRINSEIVLSVQQVEELKEQLRRNFQVRKPFTVPEFKDLLQVTRKYAIPYLEFLDRERVTRRVADKRILIG